MSSASGTPAFSAGEAVYCIAIQNYTNISESKVVILEATVSSVGPAAAAPHAGHVTFYDILAKGTVADSSQESFSMDIPMKVPYYVLFHKEPPQAVAQALAKSLTSSEQLASIICPAELVPFKAYEIVQEDLVAFTRQRRQQMRAIEELTQVSWIACILSKH